MRRLTILVVCLAALYGGYWYMGARAVETGAQNAITDLAAQGWDVAGTRAETRGFPSRFDTTFSDIALTSPDGLIRYETPFLQAFALSYRPTRIIVAAAPEHTVSLAGQTVDIATDALRASAAVAANADLSFENLTIEAKEIGISSDFGFSLRTSDVLFAARPVGEATTYDAFVRLTQITAPVTHPAQVPVDVVSLDSAVTLNRPLDRHLAGRPAPEITAVSVKDLVVDWGPARLRGEGDLTVDAQGYLEGEIALRITDHAALIDQMSYVGIVDPGVAPTWVNMGNAMADGAPELKLPLRMQNGYLSLGPFPMGVAPRVR